jgi:hypothetical protein
MFDPKGGDFWERISISVQLLYPFGVVEAEFLRRNYWLHLVSQPMARMMFRKGACRRHGVFGRHVAWKFSKSQLGDLGWSNPYTSPRFSLFWFPWRSVSWPISGPGQD